MLNKNQKIDPKAIIGQILESRDKGLPHGLMHTKQACTHLAATLFSKQFPNLLLPLPF